MKIDLQDIRSDFEGFSLLVQLAHQLKDVMFADINIDMSCVNWIDANMCAPLGAILYKASRNLNTVSFDFSITDLGIGIRQNLEQRVNVSLSAERAIKWAVSGQNTTKSGRVPGGLGLKLLKEFIAMNQGRIQIASDQGYWELKNNRETLKQLTKPFPGTAVNLEFNTADKKSYQLASEIRPEEIF